ncbi:MAG: alkaline phosphatase family protein [Alistipes sp.]|jgi:predicted AlkP superfamily pyrophosphatase or phosphodiesterase|nr:alkaline phosphatase family protein [Alistipes sp.]
MKKHTFPILSILLLSAFTTTSAAASGEASQSEALRTDERPALVVNIVVGGLSYDLLDKLSANLSDEGFSRFAAQGVRYRAAYYGYMQTLSPAGLATLTTGADPSVHGVAGYAWTDYVTGDRVALTEDRSVRGLDTEPGVGRHSGRNLVVPTVGDELIARWPDSRVVSVAAEPESAVVAGGRRGVAWWMDSSRATWTSSTAYMDRVPDWVTAYNVAHVANRHIEMGWTPARTVDLYMSHDTEIFRTQTNLLQKTTAALKGQSSAARITSFRKGEVNDYASMLASPHGNTLVADFARKVVEADSLGQRGTTDMLYVCFDAARTVGQRYGAGSMEAEDMIYRLDYDLAAMVAAITARVGEGNVLFVLTSDHGLGGVWDGDTVDGGATPSGGGSGSVGRLGSVGGSGSAAVARDRFNVGQFKTLVNSFLGVQFGVTDLVLDYVDRQLYLDHNRIYMQNLSLGEVQSRAAAFALQFRGVSHALTATALNGGYFGGGYGGMMQRGFYPPRGGDLVIDLAPGWIEERAETKSLSGSMYSYDTHVPLIVFGWRVARGAEVSEPVDMTRVAATIGHIVGTGRPVASEAAVLPRLLP